MEGIEPFLKSLQTHELWHSIWINIQDQATNQILGSDWVHISGPRFLWQRLGGIAVPFHPGAFSQTHLPLFERMLETIGDWVDPKDSVLELYAGVGAIGLYLENRVKSITLVEINPYAHLSFKETKAEIAYHLIDAKDVDFSGHSTILVDPPRKGLDPTMIPKLQSDRLIYVSCGFESFQRDAKALLELGWKIADAKGYLLFPGTNHVETLTLFERSS